MMPSIADVPCLSCQDGYNDTHFCEMPDYCPCDKRHRHGSPRPDWDTYFLDIARTVSTRADCTRRQVGAVIVRDHRIVSTGYNGGRAGGPSCLAGECPRGRMSKTDVAPGSSYDTGAGSCIALHAEQNAVIYAGHDGVVGSTLYVTDEPCDGCARFVWGAGIARVVTPDGERIAPRVV